MPDKSVLAKQCPVCGARPVEPIHGPKGFPSPTHRCPSCSALLKPSFKAGVLLCMPVGAILFGIAYFFIDWLNHLPAVSGAVRTALLGGLAGLCSAITARVALRGMVFRPVDQ